MQNKSERKKINHNQQRQSGTDVTGKVKSTLPNGVRIVSEYIPYVESFSLGICATSGSREDNPKYSGEAHFIEHLLFRLTKHGSSRHLSGKFESIGAHVNAYTAKEFTYYHTRALTGHLRKTLGLLSDLVLVDAIKQKEVENERHIIIEEIKLYCDDPEELIYDMGEEALFRGNSLSYPITGKVETVKRINSDNLHDYYHNYYTPENLIIAVSGNVRHDQLLKFAEPVFANLKSNGRKIDRVKPEIHIPEHIEIKRHVQQAYILISRTIPGIHSADRYPLVVLNELFCESMSSRLQFKLRDKLGLVYSIDSEIYFYTDCGTFYINAVTDKSNANNVVKEIKSEMQKVVRNGIFNSEIHRAKEQLKSGIIMEGENLSSRMSSLFKSEIYSEDDSSIEHTLEQIEKVTPDLIYQTALKYFEPDDWSVITILPK